MHLEKHLIRYIIAIIYEYKKCEKKTGRVRIVKDCGKEYEMLVKRIKIG